MKNFIALLLIVASIGVFYYIATPLYGEVQALRSTKAEYDQALSRSQEAQKVRQALETKYNSISVENLDRLRSFLPDHIDNIRLIIEIDKIAGRYNMTVSNAQVTVPQSNTSSNNPNEATIVEEPMVYGTGKLNFSVSGTYDEYLSFIKDLEQSLRLINITSVSLTTGTSSSSKESGNAYEYKISFDTYWLK
ncbi:hypothetical protein D4R99_05365 [bacterium]|nr:MAG: hypothetical protein D4R99_05365 [bacterium]